MLGVGGERESGAGGLRWGVGSEGGRVNLEREQSKPGGWGWGRLERNGRWYTTSILFSFV